MRCVRGDGGGLLCAGDEALSEFVPGFALGVGFGGEASEGRDGKRGFAAGNPVERDLLPEDDVPELLINGVGDAGDGSMGEFG